MKVLLVKHNYWFILVSILLVVLTLITVETIEGITIQSILAIVLTFGILIFASQNYRNSIIANSEPRLDVSLTSIEDISGNEEYTSIMVECDVVNSGLGVASISNYDLVRKLLPDIKKEYYKRVIKEGKDRKPFISYESTAPILLSYNDSDLVKVTIPGFEYFNSCILRIYEKSIGWHSCEILSSDILRRLKLQKQENA